MIKMKNSYAIGDVCRQIEVTCEKISSMTTGLEQLEKDGNEPLTETYDELRLGELEHLQRLTLALTKLITQEEDGEDGSADENKSTAE